MLNIRFVIAVLLVSIALLFTFCGGWIVKNTAQQLLQFASLVVGSDELTQVQATESLVKKWNDRKQILSLFLDSVSLDCIDNMIVQVQTAVKQKDNRTIEAVCMQLLQQLQCIADKEKFSLYNLF